MSIEIFNSSYSNVVDGETMQVADQIALHKVGVYHGSWETPGGNGSHGWNLTAQALTLGRVGLQSDHSE